MGAIYTDYHTANYKIRTHWNVHPNRADPSPILRLVVVVLFVESQATVSAGMVAGLIQIDEHSRMTERSVSAVARDHPIMTQDRRRIGNQIDRELIVDLLFPVHESGQSVVILFPHLLAEKEFAQTICGRFGRENSSALNIATHFGKQSLVHLLPQNLHFKLRDSPASCASSSLLLSTSHPGRPPPCARPAPSVLTRRQKRLSRRTLMIFWAAVSSWSSVAGS